MLVPDLTEIVDELDACVVVEEWRVIGAERSGPIQPRSVERERWNKVILDRVWIQHRQIIQPVCGTRESVCGWRDVDDVLAETPGKFIHNRRRQVGCQTD